MSRDDDQKRSPEMQKIVDRFFSDNSPEKDQPLTIRRKRMLKFLAERKKKNG